MCFNEAAQPGDGEARPPVGSAGGSHPGAFAADGGGPMITTALGHRLTLVLVTAVLATHGLAVAAGLFVAIRGQAFADARLLGPFARLGASFLTALAGTVAAFLVEALARLVLRPRMQRAMDLLAGPATASPSEEHR